MDEQQQGEEEEGQVGEEELEAGRTRGGAQQDLREDGDLERARCRQKGGEGRQGGRLGREGKGGGG